MFKDIFKNFFGGWCLLDKIIDSFNNSMVFEISIVLRLRKLFKIIVNVVIVVKVKGNSEVKYIDSFENCLEVVLLIWICCI